METKSLSTKNHHGKQTKDNDGASKANTGKGMVNKTPITQELEAPETVGQSLSAEDKQKEYQIKVCKEGDQAKSRSRGFKSMKQ